MGVRLRIVTAYDERNRISQRTINAHALNGSNQLVPYEFSHEYYSYDALSRLSQTDRHLNWAAGGAERRTVDGFSYNDAGELTAASYNSVPAPTPIPTPTPTATPTPTPGQVAAPRFSPYVQTGYNFYPNASIGVTISTTTEIGRAHV